MAHTFDTKGQILDSGSNPSTTSFTCGSTATLLVLSIMTDGSRGTGTPTYGGTDLTQAGTMESATEGEAELWYLIAPTVSTSLTVSVPNPSGGKVTTNISSYISSTGYSAFDQTAGTASGGSADPTISVTVGAIGDIIVDAMFSGAKSAATADRTVLYVNDTGQEGNGAQYHIATATGSTAMSWTQTSDDWAIVAASFKEDEVNLPTVVLNSPADLATITDTTPTFEFTGTDGDGDDIEYNVQVDTVDTFDGGGGLITVEDTGSAVEVAYHEGYVLSLTDLSVTSGNKIVVSIQIWQNVAGTGTVSSITWNTSESFSMATSYRSFGMQTEIWYLDNPTAGSHTITITVGGTVLAVKAGALSLLNTKAAYDNTSNAGGNGTTSTLSPTLTPTEDNAIIIDCLHSYAGTNAVESVTSFFENTTSTNGAAQYTIQTTASAQDMDWSWTTTGDYSHCAVAFLNNIAAPLIDKLSTTDVGFANVDTPADTHPFDSGDKCDYDVQAGGLIDSYSESNGTSDYTLYNGNRIKVSQSFTGNGNDLDVATFYLKKTGSPTGSVYANIYAHSGTFGTSSVPTGAALATSNPFDISTLTTSYQLIDFNFSTPYTVLDGTYYTISLEYSSGDISNCLVCYTDLASPTHSGNFSYYVASWTTQSTRDLCFYVEKNSEALSAGTYYWRARGTDPLGTDTYGAWATTRSFTISTGPTRRIFLT